MGDSSRRSQCTPTGRVPDGKFNLAPDAPEIRTGRTPARSRCPARQSGSTALTRQRDLSSGAVLAVLFQRLPGESAAETASASGEIRRDVGACHREFAHPLGDEAQRPCVAIALRIRVRLAQLIVIARTVADYETACLLVQVRPSNVVCVEPPTGPSCVSVTFCSSCPVASRTVRRTPMPSNRNSCSSTMVLALKRTAP